MKKAVLIVILALLTLLCFVACNEATTVACLECGFENSSGAKFCSECGASKPALNNDNQVENDDKSSCQHLWGNWHDEVSATCINNGTRERICSKCSHKEITTITALGHITTTGVCSRCNQRVGWTEKELQNIVQVHDVYVDDIDSADGVDMRISWTNTSDKIIKYIHFYVVPYNAVGDPMYCDVRNHSRYDAYVTGPCEPDYKGYYKVGDIYYGNLWENSWYNNSISTIKLVGIKIIYMDESVIEIEEKDVSKTIVKFSPLKEGYDVDETLLVYDSSTGEYRLIWSVEYLGVSVRPDLNIDVRIVNNNNVEIFSCGYYADSERFTESGIFGTTKWVIKTTISKDKIKDENVNNGTLYFRIYSEDGTIDLGERSIKMNTRVVL